ncbi:MAG: hypothetical protein J5780_02910 [Treponema sp.]|nr:hypothetical protein [Treponema sp.]
MKKILLTILTCSVFFRASAFDWPQEASSGKDFYSYFGQRRGNTISTSMIFSNSAQVHSVKDGKLLVRIREHGEDFGRFESALGNTVILLHEDSFATVSANLNGDPYLPELPSDVKKGILLGESGNSSWHKGSEALEFQVLDFKNSGAVNPRIPLPRAEREESLEISEAVFISREGTVYDAAKVKSMPSGSYSFYKKRNERSVPYRTQVYVNGVSMETITMDFIFSEDGKLRIKGNKNYSAAEFYPEKNRQLISVLELSRGKNEITVTLTDLLGNKKTERFIVDTY